MLEQDRSVASGRTMEQIAAGKGRGPQPFMAAATSALGNTPAAIGIQARREAQQAQKLVQASAEPASNGRS